MWTGHLGCGWSRSAAGKDDFRSGLSVDLLLFSPLPPLPLLPLPTAASAGHLSSLPVYVSFPSGSFVCRGLVCAFTCFVLWSGHTSSPSIPTVAQALMYLCCFWLWVGAVLGSPSQLSGPSMSTLLLYGNLAVAFQRGGEHVFFSDLDNKEKCKTKLSSLQPH